MPNGWREGGVSCVRLIRSADEQEEQMPQRGRSRTPRRPSQNEEGAEAYYELGSALKSLGKITEAVASYERAIAADPDFAKAYLKLGNLFIEQGRADKAAESYGRALSLKPDYPAAHNNLANLLVRQGSLRKAEEHLRAALALRPDNPEIHCNLGSVLLTRGELDEAAAHYVRALAVKPGLADAHYSLSTIFSRHGHLENAIAALRRALDLDPDFPEAFAQLAMLRKQACDWRDAEVNDHRILELTRRFPGRVPPADLLCLESTAQDQHRCAREWANGLAIRCPELFSHSSRTSGRKIRLGYLCADYYSHPLAHLIVDFIERHDRSAFELIAYSVAPDDRSELRVRLEAAFDRFVDLRAVDDQAAARQIHDLGTDILVDLTGYAENGRTRILASRPAPIQVNGIGYTGTSGADFIDYIIADPFVAPMDQQPFFSERLVHLPHCYMPSDTKRKILDRTPTRAECGLPPDGFVFCCFNNRYKLTPRFWDMWMRLLTAVPGSVLWLLETRDFVKDNLRREAHQRGVDPARLVFAAPVALPQFLALNRLADMFLDTLPYNAHTTANDALFAGLPVLTCVGTTFTGRVAGSLLHAIGLPELATSSLHEYEQMALKLARTPGLLAELRQKLALNRETMPLFDMARYTHDLEKAYKQMWRIWRDGAEPRPFALGAAGEP